MTLPVPGGVSRGEIDSMKRMMQIMEGASGSSNVPAQHTHQAHYSGGYAGTPPPRQPLYESAPPAYGAFPGREDVDAMKRILEKMNELDGPQQAPQRQPISESYAAPAITSSAEWSVKTNLVESNGKETKTYDVVQGHHTFVEGLVVADAAKSLARLLNRGYTAENPRVQEVLDLEETYNRHRLDATRIKSRYNRCVELGEDAAAAVFRERHQVARAEALAIQDQLKSILESIR